MNISPKFANIINAHENVNTLAETKVSSATHQVKSGRIVPKDYAAKLTGLFQSSQKPLEEAIIKSITTYQKTLRKEIVTVPKAEQKELLAAYQEVALKIIANIEGSPLESRVAETLASGVEGAQLFREAQKGIAAGHAPTPTCGGCAGSYFIYDKVGEKCGVFKPSDEELGGINNQHIGVWDYGRKGIPSGESPMREYIAKALDHGQFADVPNSVITKLTSKDFYDALEPEGLDPVMKSEKTKKGVLIEFVPDAQIGLMAVDEAKIDPSSVRRIAILDMRIWNTDRHTENFFVVPDKSGAYEFKLRPLDQGFAFSSSMDDMSREFAWTALLASEQPFDATEGEYIQSLDTKLDATLMRQAGFSQVHVDQMVLGTVLMQEGAKAGLTVQQMGEMLCNTDRTTLTIQNILTSAGPRADRATQEAMKPGYVFNGLSPEQKDGFRDDTFLALVVPQVRQLVAQKAGLV